MANYQPDEAARLMILTTVHFTVQTNHYWDMSEKMVLDRVERKMLAGDALDGPELDTLFAVLQRLIDEQARG
jgi:hypothetical protein